MSGFWYLDILSKMDRKEIDAIIDVLSRPENSQVRIMLSKYCDSAEEMAIVAKRMYGLTYKKVPSEGEKS